MKHCFLLFLLLLSGSLKSQSLTGKILVNQTEQTIAQAIVILDNGADYQITDVRGEFSFSTLAEGSHQLEINCVGFRTKTLQVDMNNTTEEALTIELEEEIYDIPGVTISSVSSTGGMMGSIDSPPSSNYISTRELKQVNSTDIDKILFNIPGINIQEEDGFGLRPNIGLRGSGSERSSKITIMEDELLSAPAPYASPSAYYFPSVARMSAIEIQKGSSQIEYGPYTTGGVMNFISTPIPTSFEGDVRANAGAFGTKNLEARIGTKVNNWSGLLETVQNYSDGFKMLQSNGSTGFYKQDYLGKLKWESNVNAKTFHSVLVKVGQTNEDSNETYLGLTASDFSSDPLARYSASQKDNMLAEQFQSSLQYIVKPNNQFVLKTSAYRNTFHRNWYKLDKVRSRSGEAVSISSLLNQPSNYQEQYELINGSINSGTANVLDVKANNRSYKSYGVQTKATWDIDSSIDQKLVAGARIHYDEMDRFQWVDGYSINDGIMTRVQQGVPGSNSNRIDNAQAFSSFVKYNLRVNQWSLTPGLRYEHIQLARNDYKEDVDRLGNPTTRENIINEWIPGMELSYLVNESNHLFLSAHKGFSPPGSNPKTKAEQSINYELGYRLETNTSFMSVVGFLNDYSNLLGADLAAAGGAGTGDLYNGGQATTYGIEFAGQHHYFISNHLSVPISIAYTYTHSQFDSNFESEFDAWGGAEIQSGDLLPYIAPNQLNVTTGLSSKKYNVRIRGNYMDAMRTNPGQGELTNENSINSRFLLNTDANYILSKHVQVLFTANNVLNKTYVVSHRPSGLRPGMPRSLSVGFEVNF